ncbi:hypothetical protein QQ045_000797 [Rhodiola kirilowii]
MYKRNMIASCMPVASDALEPEIDVNIHVIPSASMTKLKRARVSNSGASTDLQMYLDLDTLDIDEKGNCNILEWWKANSSMYPVLSLMARDLLSIPASTLASEAIFSAGGRVVSVKRASLSPNTVEALICLKDWSLTSNRKQDAEVEEYADEELMNARASQPDWLLDDAKLPDTVSANSVETGEEVTALPRPRAWLTLKKFAGDLKLSTLGFLDCVLEPGDRNLLTCNMVAFEFVVFGSVGIAGVS